MTMLIDPAVILNSLITPMKSIADRVSLEIETSGAIERLDQNVRQMLHELGDQLIEATLRRLGNRIRFEREIPCCSCGGERSFKQMRPVRIRTSLTGTKLSVPSPYIICASCNKGELWLRELLRLDEDGCTPFLQELCIEAGTIEPYESAAEGVLKTFAGVSMSSSKVHKLCVQVGQIAQELMREGEL